ncbi:MAG: phosphoribosylamine--glycine ligase [Bacteroidaceae bacterium]|nr:phosphoribosylamine--glycine ligase [Bacteroidaceae bacterium]
MKKVLVIGGGGREHAIVDALSHSPQVGKIYCAPGNAGIAQLADCVDIKDDDVNALKSFALAHDIDLTVVGPEVALSVGVVDEFRNAGLKIFGHTMSAARIESSKEFAKELMMRHGIPTASYRSFSDYEEALKYVHSNTFPMVLKYDGLAAGKGVVIASTIDEAEQALKDMLLDKSFGKGSVVIEEYLEGPEFSFMCFVNDREVLPMPLAQDHKRVFDEDKGPNTGGMGAYTGLDFISLKDRDYAFHEIMCKAAMAMADEGLPLTGVLYGGLMKTQNGIKVIEFNARFGDPETEVVLPLIKTDIFKIFSFDFSECEWNNTYSLGVVMASKGYPTEYKKGFEIDGIDEVSIKSYHMGTKIGDDGKIVTAGGRVLMLVACGDDLQNIRKQVYSELNKIRCSNLFFRSDIAKQYKS